LTNHIEKEKEKEKGKEKKRKEIKPQNYLRKRVFFLIFFYFIFSISRVIWWVSRI